MKIQIVASLPVLIFTGDSNLVEIQSRDYLDFKNELENTSFCWQVEDVITYVKFDILNKKKYKNILSEDLLDGFGDGIILAEFNADLSKYIVDRSKIYQDAFNEDYKNSKCELTNQCYFDYCDQLCRLFQNIIIAVNIVYPGLLEIAKGEISIDGVCYKKISQMNSSLYSIYDEKNGRYYQKFH